MEPEKMNFDTSEAFVKMIEAMSSNVPPSDKEYIGKDGLLHCSVCHRKTQTRVQIEFLGIDRVVRCICDCKDKEINERERLKKIKERRDKCFDGTDMADWTFENDDRKNAKLSDAMIRYTDNFREFLRQGKGLLLYGTVGTGKTYYAASVANRLIEKGYNVKLTNFATLINQIQGTFNDKQGIIDKLNSYPLLIIDDLGAERSSEFMQEMVFNIIDGRYRAGLPMIITTNLTAEEIKKPQEVRNSRIYDRILEMCFPIEVTGISRRRQHVKDTFNDFKEKLGL